MIRNLFAAFICGMGMALAAGPVAAQTPVAADTLQRLGTYLRAKASGDSVVIRWADADHIRRAATRRAGYDLHRVEVDDQLRPVGEASRLNAEPIRPWSLDQMKARFARNDSVAAVAAQILYGNMQAAGAGSYEDFDRREADQSNRHTFALFMADLYPRVADAFGWRWVDRDVQAGKRYYYFITADTEAHGVPADTAGHWVRAGDAMLPASLQTLDHIPFDGQVYLLWNRLEAETQFTAFEIERNDGPDTPFRRLNHQPWTHSDDPRSADDDLVMLFKDTLTVNYRAYTYRVRGIDAFGDRGAWAQVDAMSKDFTPPLSPQGVHAESEGGTNVRIRWQTPVREDDLLGFLVARSNQPDGYYTPIDSTLLPPEASEALDRAAVTWDRNYYVVSAVDTAGNVSRSVPVYAVLVDSVGPSKVTGLRAAVDTTGVVRLDWDLGNEPDLQGYNIYRANQADHAFQVLNPAPVVNAAFADSIELYSLTKSVFYKVVAYDNAGNPGTESDVLEVRKPDLVPPTAPVIHGFAVSDTSVRIVFLPSVSSDVASHVVLRRTDDGTAAWDEIGRLAATDTLFDDRGFMPGGVQWYALAAVDSAGLQSERSFPMRVKAPLSAFRWPEISLRVEDDGDGSVRIAWQSDGPLPDGSRVVVYREVGDGGLIQVKQLPSEAGEYVDRRLSDAPHRWALRLMLPDGRMGPLVEE